MQAEQLILNFYSLIDTYMLMHLSKAFDKY